MKDENAILSMDLNDLVGKGLDLYVEIPDIAGEAERDGHEEKIHCFAMYWDILNRGAARQGSGHTRGSADVGTLILQKFYCKSDPYLWQSCSSGRSFDEITITAQKNTGDGFMDYIVFTLRECIISKYAFATNIGAQVNVTTFGFDFSEMENKYIVQETDHTEGSEEVTTWNYPTGVSP